MEENPILNRKWLNHIPELIDQTADITINEINWKKLCLKVTNETGAGKHCKNGICVIEKIIVRFCALPSLK